MQQPKKLPFRVRPVIIAFAIIFFAIAAITWIGKLWGDWSGILPAIFTISAAISTFLAIPALYTQKNSEIPKSTKITQPLVNINFYQGQSSDSQSPLLVTDIEKEKGYDPSSDIQKPTNNPSPLLINTPAKAVDPSPTSISQEPSNLSPLLVNKPNKESELSSKVHSQDDSPEFGTEEYLAEKLADILGHKKETDEYLFTVREPESNQ